MRFCEFEKCKYPVFGTDKVTGKGYCRTHQTKRTDLDRRSIIKKAIAKQGRLETKIRSLNDLPANKQMADLKKTISSQNEWYLRQRFRMIGKCCNCPNNSPKNDDKYYKWGIAHCFPKNIFKSIAENDNNWLETCITCHTLFDRNLDTASKMPMFKLAFDKYELFKNDITEHHKYLDLFLELANQLK